MASRIHEYLGHSIYPSSYVDSKRWYVQVHHSPTGMCMSEECCPQFDTLADAKEWIDREQSLTEAIS